MSATNQQPEPTEPAQAIVVVELWETAPGVFRRRLRVRGEGSGALRDHARQIVSCLAGFFEATQAKTAPPAFIREVIIDQPSQDNPKPNNEGTEP